MQNFEIDIMRQVIVLVLTTRDPSPELLLMTLCSHCESEDKKLLYMGCILEGQFTQSQIWDDSLL